MSERILKALMHLFALIARPNSNLEERKEIVGSFLKQQLNSEQVEEYLKIFVNYYKIYQEKQSRKGKRNKSIAVSSVKILKICNEINSELTLKQRVIVLYNLLEFIKADVGEVSEQELEFVQTVAQEFHIPEDEYKRIKGFVIYAFDQIPNSSRMLLIDSNKDFKHEKIKHMYVEGMKGQIRFFHLRLTDMYFFRYLGSSELVMNGQLLHQDKVYIFTFGSSIKAPKITPIYYSDIVKVFNEDKTHGKILFEVKNIEYHFPSGNIGLHPISFTEESGRMVGIMGASGAGKSTLLSVLNGTNSPTRGEVLINKINIHKEKEKLEGLIGFVSQDDLLIEELTVFENLYFNAKLCFDNYSEFQIIRTVFKTLQTLGLYEIRNMKVGSPLNKKISGGQRKRLNIALELIREPAVLFLDEPTSGLSSRDSENIMDLLKDLSLKGKLIFVVIHQPSSDIFKMFDNLLILDQGGYMVYCGPPVEAIVHFKASINYANWQEAECPVCGNVNPEQIFNILESTVLDEYGSPTMIRKISPKEWNEIYLKSEFSKKAVSITAQKEELILPKITFNIPNKIKQAFIFLKRDILSKLANSQYLIINALETPVLAFLLSYIIKYWSVDVSTGGHYIFSKNENIPAYLYMAVIVAIFIGLTVSAEEIIKDRKILIREKFLNLSWGSFIASKIFILLSVAVIQALMFAFIGNYILEIKGMYFHYWLMLFSAWAFAIILGLNISDAFKTAVTIYISIPFLVIPQMILSGVVFRYDKLNPTISSPTEIPIYGEIITARWAYEGLAVHQYKDNAYERIFYPYDKIINDANYKKDYWLVNLMNKASFVKRNLKKKEKKQDITNALELLRNELSKELKHNKRFKFDKLNKLYYDKITPSIIESTQMFLKKLKKYYIAKSKLASQKKDALVSKLQNTPEKRELFLKMKKEYTNDKLTDFVRNRTDLEGIIEYKNRLYRKIDPIYQDPEHKFIRAHFYAPRKRLGNIYIDTYWMNVFVIWFFNILLIISLYFRWFRKTLDKLGEISGKFIKPKD